MEEQEGKQFVKNLFAFSFDPMQATGCSTLPIQIPGITQPTLAATLSVPITVHSTTAVNEPAGKPKATATLAPTTPYSPKLTRKRQSPSSWKAKKQAQSLH
jgi:hypothetical protein